MRRLLDETSYWELSPSSSAMAATELDATRSSPSLLLSMEIDSWVIPEQSR